MVYGLHFFKQSWTDRILSYLTRALVGFILLLALIFNLLQIYLPIAFNNKQAYFAQWASSAVHSPVHIAGVQARWRYFSPVVQFNSVDVLNLSGKPLARIQKLTVAISLWRSLLNWQFVPGELIMSGAQLDFDQDNNTGPHFEASSSSDQKEAYPALVPNEVIAWLLSQGSVTIQNLSVNWRRADGTRLPIRNIELRIKGIGSSRNIIGSAELPETMAKRLVIGAELSHIDLKKMRYEANVYIGLTKMNLANWAKSPLMAPYLGEYHLTEGVGDAQFWLHWKKKQFVLAQAQVDFNKSVLVTPSAEKWIIGRFSANLAWKRDKKGWSVLADHVLLHINDEEWHDNSFGFQFLAADKEQPAQQLFGLKFLKLHDLKFLMSQWSGVPAELKKSYQALNPQGSLNNIVLQHVGSDWSAASVKLSSDFSRLRLNAWNHSPGISNFSGSVYWSNGVGQLSIDSQNLAVNMPTAFSAPLKINKTKAKVNWSYANSDDWNIRVDHFLLDDTNLSVEGQSVLDMSSVGTSLRFISHFKLGDLTQLKSYLPKPVMDNDLYDWLTTSFKGGSISEGSSLVFEGQLKDFPFKKHEGHFEVLAKLKEVDLAFAKNWPTLEKINGDLVFDNAGMSLNNASARMLDNPLTQLNANIPDLEQGLLAVGGHSVSDLKNGARVLSASPLAIAEDIAGLNMQGPMELNIRLQVPLNQYARTHFKSETNGELFVKKASVTLPAWHVGLENVEGQLQFTGDSLVAPQLKAELFSQPVAISIYTVQTPNAPSKVQLSFKGNMNMDQLQKRWNEKWLSYFHGSTDYQIQLDLYETAGTASNSLSLNSDLKGIAIDIDSFYQKPANQAENLQLQISVPKSDQAIELNAQYGKNISSALSFVSKKGALHFQGGELALGDQPAQPSKESGLNILISVPSFSWEAWKPIVNKVSELAQEAQSGDAPSLLHAIHLKTKRLAAFDYTLSDVDLMLQPKTETEQWVVDINSSGLVGNITVPKDSHLGQPVIAHLARLYVPKMGDSKSSSGFDLAQWPALNVTAADFRYGNDSLGQLSLLTEPEAGGIKINKMQLSSNSYEILVTGDSHSKGKRKQSNLVSRIKSSDFGTLFKRLNMADALEEGEGTIDFALGWKGPLFSLDLPSLTGYIDINMTDGSIVKLSSSAQSQIGLSHLLNILTLQSIPTLGGLTQHGFGFDVLKARFDLAHGHASSQNIYLNGPVAKVRAKGVINYIQKNYDINMTVNPYITSSLPTVATLATGFNPIVGAVFWLVNKVVINPAVGKAAQFDYRVTGSWDKPSIVELPKPTQNAATPKTALPTTGKTAP